MGGFGKYAGHGWHLSDAGQKDRQIHFADTEQFPVSPGFSRHGNPQIQNGLGRSAGHCAAANMLNVERVRAEGALQAGTFGLKEARPGWRVGNQLNCSAL